MIKIPLTNSYREKVNELYSKLKNDGWSNLRLFEWRYRMIHLLNAKIKNRTAQTDKEEGNYSTCTY